MGAPSRPPHGRCHEECDEGPCDEGPCESGRKDHEGQCEEVGEGGGGIGRGGSGGEEASNGRRIDCATDENFSGEEVIEGPADGKIEKGGHYDAPKSKGGAVEGT